MTSSKQIYAFGEKSKTGGVGGKSDGQMFLRSTTKVRFSLLSQSRIGLMV